MQIRQLIIPIGILKMTVLLLSCSLLFASPCSTVSPRICFEEASSEEFTEIQQQLLSFYSAQLINAGLFEDLDKALAAATIEWNQNQADNFYCYHLISEDSSTRYGYLVYSILDQTAYLEAINLEKTYRGQGLGKQILQDFETELKKKNVVTIKLYVFAQNDIALKLYSGMGFIIETTFLDGDKLIGHHMKKSI